MDITEEPKTPEAPKLPKTLDAPGAPMKAEKPKKVSEPKKVPDENKPMAISKMKKPDLIAECNARGLDSKGTVPELKQRIKEARAAPQPSTGYHTQDDDEDEDEEEYKDAIPILPTDTELNPFTNEGEFSDDGYVIIIINYEIAVTTYQDPPAVGAYMTFIHDQTREFIFSGTVTGKHYIETKMTLGEVPNEELEHYVMK